MRDRGYPTGEFDRRVQTLSVEHARTLEPYRRAHDISLANLRGQDSTEQLRQAVMQYRALASALRDVEDLTPRRTASDHPNAQGSPMTYPPGPSGRSPSQAARTTVTRRPPT
jgi:hypothetical protein